MLIRKLGPVLTVFSEALRLTTQPGVRCAPLLVSRRPFEQRLEGVYCLQNRPNRMPSGCYNSANDSLSRNQATPLFVCEALDCSSASCFYGHHP